MNGEKAAGSVFMCRLCNLFSPSRSHLLAHCSQNHPQLESPDGVIIALQPLITEPAEKLPESPVKRKRGRPKGSTKKLKSDFAEETPVTAQREEKDTKREESRIKEGEQQCGSVKDGESQDGVLGLECRDCHRTFSNKRQILKHICLREEDEEEAGQQSGGTRDADEGETSGGADSRQTKQKLTTPGNKRENDTSSSKLPRVNRAWSERRKTTGQKKSVINVVLTEDEILPAGVCKMVPVEDISAETESTAVQAQHQGIISEVTAYENNPTAENELSSTLNSQTTASTSKGFQEYSIKQDAANLAQSKLKIFACEFCNKIFKFRHSLVAHLRTHTREKPFQCPHCDYASAIKANLNVHLRKHTGEKFSCERCAFSCLSPGHLKVHVERVHLKMKQHCSFCEKKYSDVKNLLKHMETRHNLNDSAVLQTYQQLRLKTRQGLRQLLYHCPTCNRRFKNQQERERHLLIHGPQPPFACLLCDHTATKMVALAAHVRKHLFLYLCSVCNKKLVSSQRLRGHLEESHPELDMEETFMDSINISYYLIPPEGGGGREEAEDTGTDGGGADRTKTEGDKGPDGEEEGKQQHEGEQTKSVQVLEEEIGKEERLKAGGVSKDSQDKCDEAAAEEKIHNQGASVSAAPDPPAEITPSSLSPESVRTSSLKDRTGESTPAVNPASPSSPGVSILSALAAETLCFADSQKENSQSSPAEKGAFQQVFSSLQKTRLDMETYQRLRKIYGDLECQYCGKLFWYKVHYNVHVRTHTKEHLHYCSKCSYSSITKSSLKRHQVQKHSGLLLPCSIPGCKYATPDKYKLQAHTRTQHEQESRAVCPVCQGSYPQHRLKHHLKSSHPETLPVGGKGMMVQRAEKCPYCDSYFLKNSGDFQQHIWAHQGLKPYVCSVCDYASCSRSNLKTHMNRHNSEKHHLCDLCGKKFKSKLTLKSHRLSHTDEGKRFQCSECPFTSVFRPSLLRHMEQHAEFKPFRCAHCHYSCNIAGALKRHYNIKHPEETYENAGPGLPNPETLKQQGGMKCPECEFVYGTKWELTRHLKTKHNLKVVEGNWEVAEETEAQYVSAKNEEDPTEAPLAVLEDNGNVQQMAELSSETHEAVASMVAMAPGTVTLVQQVAQEQEAGDCSNQLMVVNADEAFDGNQVMVVEDHGLDALAVLTQEESTHHYIVYIQEQTVEIN